MFALAPKTTAVLGTANLDDYIDTQYSTGLDRSVGSVLLLSRASDSQRGVIVSFTAMFVHSSPVKLQIWRPDGTTGLNWFKLVYEKAVNVTFNLTKVPVEVSGSTCYRKYKQMVQAHS